MRRRTAPVTVSYALGADVAATLDDGTVHYGTVYARRRWGTGPTYHRVSGLPDLWLPAGTLAAAPRPAVP